MDVLSDHTHHAVIVPVRQYLEHLKALKYSQKSINSYNNALSRFVSFLTAKNINRVVDVTSKDLAAYRLELVDQAYAEHSIGAYLRTVRKLFKYLEDTRQIFVNPAGSMIIPGAKIKLKPVPTEEDMKNLLSQPDISTHEGIRDRAILEIMYSTGVRLEELIHMNIHDVRKKEKIIKVLGKGNKERMVPFGKKAAFWLTAYIQDVRPVFLQNRPDRHALWLGAQGNRIHPLIVERMVSGYGKQANITCRVTPHGLRRACATHMLRGGAHPVQIQLLLGHAGMSALSRYLKITVNDMLKMHSQTKPGR